MFMTLAPLETVGAYRGPRGLRWRFGSGIDCAWSLKDFGNDIPVALLITDRVLDTPRLALQDFGIDTRWIERAGSPAEQAHRMLGVAFAMQAGVDRPDVWLGRDIHFGFGSVRAFDAQMYQTEQDAIKAKVISQLRVKWSAQRPRFDWRQMLRQMALMPLALIMAALPATDAFTTGSDQALTTYSASWSNNSNVFQVLTASGTVKANSFDAECAARWNADTFNNDQYAIGSVSANSGGAGYAIGIATRCSISGAATYYHWYSTTTAAYLGKFITGTWTQLGTDGSAWSAGATCRLDANGTTITPKINGSAVTPGAQTDSGIASGSAGLSGYSNSSSTTLDNWEGGNISVPASLLVNDRVTRFQSLIVR